MRTYKKHMIGIGVLFLGTLLSACSNYDELTPDRGNLNNLDFVLPVSPFLTDGDRLVIEDQQKELLQAIENKKK